MNWQKNSQRLIEVSIMCGDKPCSVEERKTVSLLSLGIIFLAKQLRDKTVEHSYEKHKELTKNCGFENNEEILIRDVFITKPIDPEIQKDVLKQTTEPRQVLDLAINIELGIRNQHQIQH